MYSLSLIISLAGQLQVESRQSTGIHQFVGQVFFALFARLFTCGRLRQLSLRLGWQTGRPGGRWASRQVVRQAACLHLVAHTHVKSSVRALKCQAKHL